MVEGPRGCPALFKLPSADLPEVPVGVGDMFPDLLLGHLRLAHSIARNNEGDQPTVLKLPAYVRSSERWTIITILVSHRTRKAEREMFAQRVT